MRRLLHSDRGAGLAEYALLVALISLGSIAGVTFLGGETSESFVAVGEGFDSELEEDAGLSPEEKWDKAQDDYDDAIAEAKEQRDADRAKAKADFEAAKAENQDLPKKDRNAANKEAKKEYNKAKQQANQDYKTAVNEAKDARNAAKTEYKNSK